MNNRTLLCHNHSPVVDKRSALLATLASEETEWPRRGSLPNPSLLHTFPTKQFGPIQVSLSRPPSTEVLKPNYNTRLQETPLPLR